MLLFRYRDYTNDNTPKFPLEHSACTSFPKNIAGLWVVNRNVIRWQ